MVLELENWQKVMEFCDQSWNFTNCDYAFFFFADIEKPSVSLESLNFPHIVANAEFEQRDSYEKLRNGHGKVLGESLWEPCRVLSCLRRTNH